VAAGSAAIQARQAGKSAKLQTNAANHAADSQERSQAEALAFTRANAQSAYENDEKTRRANYDQWAARERRLGAWSESLGNDPRQIPDYVPGVDPRYTAGATPVPTVASAVKDAFGRSPGDPLYGVPKASPRQPGRPGPGPQSVGAALAPPPPIDVGDPSPLYTQRARRGTPGSVASYLR
jgi:hypothetical protein